MSILAHEHVKVNKILRWIPRCNKLGLSRDSWPDAWEMHPGRSSPVWFSVSGNPTYRDLVVSSNDNFRVADDPLWVFAGHVEDGAFVEFTASSGLART
jgi:hypothetical protein